MTATIKSLEVFTKNKRVQLRLRMKSGIDKFLEMPTHTIHSAAVVVETMRRSAARFNDENIILREFA